MPKIKVPTSPLKRPVRLQRKPLDVVTCTAVIKETEAVKEKKNGLKTKEKLCNISSKESVEAFRGFSLKAVLKEYSELVSTLCLPTAVPPGRNIRPRREGKTNALILIDDDSSSDESSSSSSSSSTSVSSSPPPPSPQEDYIPKPRSKPPLVLLTKTGEVRKRGVRCGECPACLRPDDCAACDFCRDKPKFGGPGIKKQACIYRKCHHLIRHAPLKCKPKRVYIPDGSPPPPRRHKTTSTETHPLHASPIRPRRFASGSERTAAKSKNPEPETPHLNIFWPMEADISGTPIYSVKSVTSRPSVCLKCGGAGKMIRCLVCCQSFHSFCAEVKGQDGYTCLNCITCRVCGHGNNCVACVVCGGRYHERCVSSDHRSTHNTGGWRCVACTKCVSCKTTIPGSDIWYEDFTYCNGCHSLKVKGNYCPLCGECYSDSDYDSKMVQCGRCDHWVHAACEGMSDQDYEILSELPEDDVLFLCKLCSTDRSWKPVVDQFFQESIGKLLEVFGRGRSEFKQYADKEHSNLINFNAGIMSRLASLLSSLSASSRKQLTSARNTYEELLSELFPWFKEEEAKHNSRETTPTNHPLDWPAILCHDHCYWSSGATKEMPMDCETTPTATTTTDLRRCVLCTTLGDTNSEGPGRLLPCSVDEWIHVNCAVWSAEVYEEVTGTLRCVQAAITRGCRLRCDSCREVGATVGCCTSSCSANFHFQCARDAKCAFLNNKEVYCSKHRGGVASSDVLSAMELVAVDHCIFIDAHPDRPGRKMPRKLEATKIAVQLGSLVVSHMGGLVELSDTPTTLLPHNYIATCEFWSVDAPSAPTHYTLTVSAAQPDDWITLLETTPSSDQTIPTDEHGTLSVEVGGLSKSIWDDLFPPPTKMVKVQKVVESAPLKPLNGGIKLDLATTTMVTNGMTFVPMLRDSQLILYPAPYLNGLSPNKEHHATPLYPNPRAIEDFKIPKRRIDDNLITMATNEMTAISLQVSSEDAVAHSVTLRRLKAGLQGNPLSLTFKVTSSDGHSWTNSKLEDVWTSVLSELQEQRAKLDLPYLSYPPCNVYRQFGLDHPLVVQLLEQLPDAPRCSEYQFRYHTPSHSKHWRSLRTLDNPTGCARSEPYNGIRSPRDMFSFLTSDHRPGPPLLDHNTLEIIMATSENASIAKLQSTSDLPAAMRYRSLQKTYKQHVDVFGSGIHGLGLFCIKDIDPGDMVIEYTGTVIRSVLTDKREKIYDSKGIGCYMFRIDSDDVVDATMSGNQARFINHSCEPNCYSKVITCDGNKKIMIFALRKIVPGEELTYDYKFPLEEAKIPCNCGTRRCRKTMN